MVVTIESRRYDIAADGTIRKLSPSPIMDGAEESAVREVAMLASCLSRIARIIEGVDNRCMASDGPVTPTLQEMTQRELSEVYALAKARTVRGPREGGTDVKTARERAVEFADQYRVPTKVYREAVKALELSFKEAMRDQRHLIAERELVEFASYGAPVKEPGNLAHAVAMNTPFPGED